MMIIDNTVFNFSLKVYFKLDMQESDTNSLEKLARKNNCTYDFIYDNTHDVHYIIFKSENSSKDIAYNNIEQFKLVLIQNKHRFSYLDVY